MATASGLRMAIGDMRAVRGHWENVLRTRRAELRRDPDSVKLQRSVMRIVSTIADIDRIILELKEGQR